MTRLPRTPAMFALAFVLTLSTARAGQPGPAETMRRTVDDAFAVLKDRSLAGRQQRSARIAALRVVADRVFDWAEMARSSLGVQWRSLDAKSRAQFVEVFKDVLAAQYMDDIDRFQGTEVITVHDAVPQGDDVLVPSTLVTGSRDRVPIDYRMRLDPARRQWVVVDISIEGVSLVNHFRKTFTAALTNISVDQLIEKLRRQLPRRP